MSAGSRSMQIGLTKQSGLVGCGHEPVVGASWGDKNLALAVDNKAISNTTSDLSRGRGEKETGAGSGCCGLGPHITRLSLKKLARCMAQHPIFHCPTVGQRCRPPRVQVLREWLAGGLSLPAAPAPSSPTCPCVIQVRVFLILS